MCVHWVHALQVRSAKKVEVQAQRRSEKAAREAAQKDREQRSYSHLMQARVRAGSGTMSSPGKGADKHMVVCECGKKCIVLSMLSSLASVTCCCSRAVHAERDVQSYAH